MPKVRRGKKSPPEGWELIEPTLEVRGSAVQCSVVQCSAGAGGQDARGRDGRSRGEAEGGGAVAHLQDPPPEVEVRSGEGSVVRDAGGQGRRSQPSGRWSQWVSVVTVVTVVSVASGLSGLSGLSGQFHSAGICSTSSTGARRSPGSCMITALR